MPQYLKHVKTGVVVEVTDLLNGYGSRNLVPFNPDAVDSAAEIDALRKKVAELEVGKSDEGQADFNRITVIAEAIGTLTPDQFTAQGFPRADALEALVGKTTAEERQQAMELNKKE